MTDAQVQSLTQAFRDRFAADVEADPVNRRGRYRFAVVSAQFDGMTHLARQDAVWAVADATLPRDAALDVSLILAYTPAELAAAR